MLKPHCQELHEPPTPTPRKKKELKTPAKQRSFSGSLYRKQILKYIYKFQWKPGSAFAVLHQLCEKEREHMFVRPCVWVSEKNMVVASFYTQTWTKILHPLCKHWCCHVASHSLRGRLIFITLVFLSTLFEHLPLQTMANWACLYHTAYRVRMQF